MYYQLNHSDCYHFCENCELLRRILKGSMLRYKVNTKKPTGEACDQCRSKERRGDCEKAEA